MSRRRRKHKKHDWLECRVIFYRTDMDLRTKSPGSGVGRIISVCRAPGGQVFGMTIQKLSAFPRSRSRYSPEVFHLRREQWLGEGQGIRYGDGIVPVDEAGPTRKKPIGASRSIR